MRALLLLLGGGVRLLEAAPAVPPPADDEDWDDVVADAGVKTEATNEARRGVADATEDDGVLLMMRGNRRATECQRSSEDPTSRKQGERQAMFLILHQKHGEASQTGGTMVMVID